MDDAITDAGRKRGPKVWLDMDQKALDDAYDQRVYAPNQPLLARRRRAANQAVLARLTPERFAYGPTEVEQLDWYRTQREGAPVQIFIHGGAWRQGEARDFAFPAEMVTTAGAHFVVPDFIQVEEVGGSLMPMAEQVRRAVGWVYKNAGAFGGDPERLHIAGHSSGAHLAGVALVTDWEREFGLSPSIVKGAVLASGMYDLKPVRLSKRGEYVMFTDAMEEALSTQRHLAAIQAPAVVIFGTEETPEFQRQSREFAAAMKAAGKSVELLAGEALNHFEVQETFGNPYGLAGRALLRQLGLRLVGAPPA